MKNLDTENAISVISKNLLIHECNSKTTINKLILKNSCTKRERKQQRFHINCTMIFVNLLILNPHP